MGEYGEPWAVVEPTAVSIRSAPDGGSEHVRTVGMISRRRPQNITRIVRCVNALAGAPDAVLEAPTAVESLCLAALRSGREDATVYAALADEAAARVTGGEGYVSREELLRVLWVLFGRLTKPDLSSASRNFRGVWWSSEEHGELAALLDRADPGGPRHTGEG